MQEQEDSILAHGVTWTKGNNTIQYNTSLQYTASIQHITQYNTIVVVVVVVVDTIHNTT